MVEHPERIEPLHLRVRALLPVDPPKVDPICLMRMMQLREVVLNERPVRKIKRNPNIRFGINTHCDRHRLVCFLKPTHPVRRVQVNRDHPVVVLQPLQEAAWIREEIKVPRITRPTAPVSFRNIGDVPVHVDDTDRERNIFRLEACHQILVFLLTITPVATPPVTEYLTR